MYMVCSVVTSKLPLNIRRSGRFSVYTYIYVIYAIVTSCVVGLYDDIKYKTRRDSIGCETGQLGAIVICVNRVTP